MKKLIILPVDSGAEGYLGQLTNGSYYPYHEEIGTSSTTFDIHLVDTELYVQEENWFINGYGHVNCAGYCDADQIHTGKPNQVIIASTQSNLGVDSIPQFIIDKFLENTEMDWLVDYGTTETGEFVTLCSSNSNNIDIYSDSMAWWNSLGSQAQYLIGLHYDVTTAKAIKEIYNLK